MVDYLMLGLHIKQLTQSYKVQVLLLVWLRNMMKYVYKKGLDVKLIASIHDEYQFEVNKNDIQSMGEVVKLSIKETTEQLNLKCPLDAEFKTGSSWADTH